MPRPITTLFMLMSIDGKISTGDSDHLDFDQDLPKIDGVKDGLHQYYELEKQTDTCSFNTTKGVEYLSKWVRSLNLVTTNKQHPAYSCGLANVEVISFDDAVDFRQLFEKLRTEHEVERMTIQSGGTLNARLIRDGLIDHLSIVVAPVVVGGASTPTLVDGDSLHHLDDLKHLTPFELVSATPLENSYLHLRYDLKTQQ